LDNPSNVSDHYAVIMHIPIDGNSMTDSRRYQKPVVTQEYRWDKGDRNVYYADTGDLLSKIVHIFPCKGTYSLCHNASHCHDISVSEMTYTVSSGTLNSTIPYHYHDIEI